MTVDAKLVARIQKLHAMAESAREVGSLAEADSFMAAVEKTLRAANLDMSVLDIDLRNVTDPMGKTVVNGTGRNGRKSMHKNRSVEWMIDLASIVAHAHFCAMTYYAKSTIFTFYGRKVNRETAVRMFTYLADLAERAAWDSVEKEAYRLRQTYGTTKGIASYRLNWLQGFAEEVGGRYAVMRARVESDSGAALVLSNVGKEARDFVKDTVVFSDKPDAPKAADFYNANARAEGKKAAASAQLRPHVLEEEAVGETAKKIGAGK